MPITLPPEARNVFEMGDNYSLDNSKTLAYGLANVSSTCAEDICDQITTSYAKDTLNWPNGRLAKPDIFSVVHDGAFETMSQCAEHFVQHLKALIASSSSKELPLYPHAFVAIAQKEDKNIAILVLAHKANGDWLLEHRTIPIRNELGLTVTSLVFGDLTESEILDQYETD